MNVAELKKYLQERGVSVSGYLKTSLVEIADAVERMVLPVDPNFESKGSVSHLMDDLDLIIEQVEVMVNSIQKGVENVLRK